jgi:tetratricopeptide (TPR) repeat protein
MVTARLGAFVLIAAGVASSGCTREPQQIKATALNRANAYLAQNRLPEAIIEYRNAVQVDPRDGDARLQLADAYLRRGELRLAAEEYVRAADLLVDRADVQRRAGNLLLLNARFDDARLRAEKALALKPNDVDAQILLANSLAGLKRFDDAIAEIEEAIAITPERGSTYATLGAFEVGRGQPEAAERAFKRAIELDSDSASAHLALANFYWLRQQWAETEVELKQTLALDPQNVLAHRAMATYSSIHNRPTDVELHLKKVREITKSDAAGLALADFYVAQGRLAAARSVLDSLTNTGSVPVEAVIRLAVLDHAAGQKSEAYVRLEQTLGPTKSNVRAAIARSELLLTDGRLEDAFKQIEAAVRIHPESAGAFATLGRIETARRNSEAAIAAYSEVLRLNPRAAGARLALARLHLATNRQSESVGFAEEAVKSIPQNPDARLTLIRGLLLTGEVERAERELRPLLAAFPTSAAVKTQQGVLLVRRKDLRAARRAFEEALALDPRSVEAVGGLVSVDLGERQPDAARARVAMYAGRQDVTPPELMLAARTYSRTGDQHSAEQVLRRLIQIAPSYVPGYAALGQLYMRQRRLDAAVEEFEAMAAREAKPVVPLTLMGVIFQAQGKHAEARARYERALQIDPAAPVAANNLAWMLAESGESLDVALQLAQAAARALPDAAEVNDTLGFVYYKKGLLPQAIQAFRASLAKDESNAEHHHHLGLALAKNGDTNEAARHLDRALKLHPTFPGAPDAQALLRSLPR